jgi:hypothetical protein
LSDPLSTVYDAFWTNLETVSDLTSLVLDGNRLKFDKRNAIKGQVQSADLPELRVILVGGDPRHKAHSGGTMWLENYEIGLLTGENEISRILMPLRWALRKAVNAVELNLPALDLSTWEGSVVSVNPTAVRDGVSPNALARGIDGWMSFWSIDVLLSFSKASLTA